MGYLPDKCNCNTEDIAPIRSFLCKKYDECNQSGKWTTTYKLTLNITKPKNIIRMVFKCPKTYNNQNNIDYKQTKT
jgi:hypothetical protein